MEINDKKCEKELGQAVGNFIKKRTKELEMKQYDVYKCINVDRATLYNYEKGRTKIPLSRLLGLCTLLKFEIKINIDKNGVNVLFEREEDKLSFKNESGESNEKKVTNDID